ncbi:MAG: TonB-dependent receptor, partial [Bacteroidetes bacterium]|nr:TonB-dependent receptor [Bacteroidota bacterium]
MYLPLAGTFLYINDVLQGRNDTIAGNTQNNFISSVYLEDKYIVNNKFYVRGGIRGSLIHASGKTWLIPEPRFTMNYYLNEKMSINGSWSITTQSIHRLTSSSVMQTSDLWVHSTQNTRPEVSSLFVAGMKYQYNHGVLAGLELYYKKMYNLIAYRDGATYMTEPYWENNIVYGEGTSKSVEVLIQKAGDKMFGLIAYTLSFTY